MGICKLLIWKFVFANLQFRPLHVQIKVSDLSVKVLVVVVVLTPGSCFSTIFPSLYLACFYSPTLSPLSPPKQS